MKFFRVRTTGSLPKLSAAGPNFPMDMNLERFILLSLSKKRPKTFFQTQGVLATGDWACAESAPWIQQHSVGHYFFGTSCTLDSTLTFLMWLLSPAPVDIISMLIVNMEWDLKFGLLSYAVQSNFVVICSSRVRSKWSGVKSNLEESAFIFVAPVALG